MKTLLFCTAILVFCAACLAVCIAVAVQVTRDHLILARKDRAEALAWKGGTSWRGCVCLVCRVCDKVPADLQSVEG